MSTETAISISSRRFRVALRRQGRFARLRGEITKDEWLAIRQVVWHGDRELKDGTPIDLLDEVQQEFHMNLVASGKLAANEQLEEIDWERFIDFLKELLPLIIEFIKALMLIFI